MKWFEIYNTLLAVPVFYIRERSITGAVKAKLSLRRTTAAVSFSDRPAK